MSFAIFLIVAVVLVAAGVAALVFPLWRGSHPDAPVRRLQRAHAAVLRQLDRALEAGAIDAAVHRQQSAVLDKRLREALGQARAGGPGKPRRGSRILAAGMVLAVPVLVAGLYSVVGDPSAIGRSPEAGSPQVERMVAGLAARLESHPDDLEGWTMLGRSYVVLGRYHDALDAFDHAIHLSDGSDPDISLDYAEVLVLNDPNTLVGRAAPLIEAALRQAPANPKALYLGGLLAQARGDNAVAIQRFDALLNNGDLPDKFRDAVEAHLRAVGGQVPATGPQPASASGDARQTGVEVHVSLAPSLAGKVPADASLFVFARRKGGNGGPPLAVRRLQVKKLPVDVRLTDADSMMGGSSLESGGALRIVARIALHGGALAQTGDLEGQADYDGDRHPVTVQIDRVVR
ncbi:MAG: c-type cytochrome biogenesis protein CcmI [Gammaproteobacteria bacterium]|nr:c-type cytochrome biogenesis protein CcmI [Gammaproteobacteria bacterium]